MRSLLKNILLIAVLLATIPMDGISSGLETGKIDLRWGTEAEVNDQAEALFKLHGADMVDGIPVVYHSIRLPEIAATTDVELFDLQFEALDISIPEFASEISNDFQVLSASGIAKGKSVIQIEITPLRIKDGRIERLRSFRVRTNYTSKPRSFMAMKRGAVNSVLNSANGNFYKFGVNKTGVFKMEKNFMVNNLGIPEAEINLNTIKFYGNGGGMLPEHAGETRPDDLQEIAIKVVDNNSDGLMDANDYILFYAIGPSVWKFDTTDRFFYFQKNLYSNYSYYFISTQGGSGPKRITDKGSTGSATHTASEFVDLRAVETENLNLISTGRIWYGEHFDELTTSRTFNFTVPDMVTSKDVRIKTKVAARSIYGTTTFDVRASGTLLYTLSCGKAGNGYDQIYALVDQNITEVGLGSGNFNVSLTYSPNTDATAWLDYINVNATRQLKFSSGQLTFRDTSGWGMGNFTTYQLNSSVAPFVWDVTDPYNVTNQVYTGSGTLEWTLPSDDLNEFVVHSGNYYTDFQAVGKIANQDLHGRSTIPDLIILTTTSLYSQAKRLADHRMVNTGLDVALVTIDQVYNEFSSGAQDITAIRDYVKMFYDRAAGDTTLMPKYLLLFGDCSYDYKNIQNTASENTNLIPIYQSFNSINPLSSFSTDDYFGFLDDTEGENIQSAAAANLLDIAIGRIPARDAEEAKAVVDKILHYESVASFGPWRNVLCYIGDDEDGNIHMSDVDDIAELVKAIDTSYNTDKIYLDAYTQNSGIGEDRYPDVNRALTNRILNGALMVNYMGHGGPGGWAHERILASEDITEYTNMDNLPLLVTATCSFSKMDDPQQVSGGEHFLTNSGGGAIALVSTTRIVYTTGNRALNENFTTRLFTTYGGRMPTIGEVMMLGKNATASNENNRKFALLGDPSMTLAYPELEVVTTSINGNTTLTADTIKALQKVTVTGEVQMGGSKMTGFNGTLAVTIFDKELTLKTLANDPASYVADFKLQKNAIFSGKASVVDGEFTFTFIVPKDISYTFGAGKISYYADNGLTDGHGFLTTVYIGGTDSTASDDNLGPEVLVYMNDETFASGGITDEEPLLLVKLSDDNGINTVGNGIGHDITAVIDELTENEIVLNDYYEATIDDYTSGEVRYKLEELEAGLHTMKVKAWDVYNNSGEGYTEFIVEESAELALDRVLNYPNPFTTKTNFIFEHNRPGDDLEVQVQIFTISGKLVKTISMDLVTDDYQVNLDDGLEWDGLDDYGDRLGKGVYVYKLSVMGSDNSVAQKLEKLVILR